MTSHQNTHHQEPTLLSLPAASVAGLHPLAGATSAGAEAPSAPASSSNMLALYIEDDRIGLAMCGETNAEPVA